MNRVVNSTFRNIQGDGVQIENGAERSEGRAFPARTRDSVVQMQIPTFLHRGVK